MEKRWTRSLPVVTEMIDTVNGGAISEQTDAQGDLFALRGTPRTVSSPPR
ncbi:LOW QUALITY PROTEIN: oxidoreductase, NAD-binding domain protein [Cutibacterium modestum P08]|uniref:Uncharacterized protein n=1 Tax=Cutibacterium modestum TaxID=2559073 RepID=A0AAD1KNJ7_9ACTN|nr:LOW QUALITY PROTEIN: oxidoreductase, NAD-binding domain protein [Cutibacterium modestum P08]BCY24236.1 hypothetical protein KB1_02260 [Cutibacterium modestum]